MSKKSRATLIFVAHPESRSGTTRLTAFALFFALLSLFSCQELQSHTSFYIIGSNSEKAELRTLFYLLDYHDVSGQKPDSELSFAAARKISAILLRQGAYQRAANFLLQQAGRNDRYASWYLFTAAASYESGGEIQLALPLYDRLLKNYPDFQIDGQSLHQASLMRLTRMTTSPERKIEYYRDLIARFPDSPDIGASYFLLAKEYEKTGEWKKALEYYARFLPYFGTRIPDYPDALQYAQSLLELEASSKDWVAADLDALVAAVKKALSAGSSQQLRKLASKAGFFARSWYQDSEVGGNTKFALNFNQYMKSGPIRSDASLHPSSSEFEAYLRTWGWTSRVPVWYLYFRKVNFPADPEIHGKWEWAGIYYGEKLQ